MDTSVLIVGAGPIGLVVANLLGLYGIQAWLIERNTGRTTFPRAISIDDEGLRICQALGLREQVLKHVRLDLGAEYRSRGRSLVRVRPRNRSNGYPLISTFDQPGLEGALLSGLERFPHIEVCFGHTLESFVQTEQEVRASIRTLTGQFQHCTCSYLLACDGGKSSIRRALGITMRGTTFPQRWLVVDGLCKEPTAPEQQSSITFFCDPARPAVSVPAPEQAWRWEFMLHPHEDESRFLTSDHFRTLLQQIGDPRAPEILRQSIYTFHAAHASTFGAGRVFLLGDAAHLLPPFGGQGMNCGLRDACNLAWKLALVLRDQATPDLLATYQQERAPNARQMIRFSAFLGNVVMPTSRLRAALRDRLLRLLLALPPAATSITEMRVKPASSYRDGLRCSDGSRLARACSGQLLPQPVVQTPDGTSMLLDDLLGSGFALLLLSTDPATAFTSLQADFWRWLKVRYICLVPAMGCLSETSMEDGEPMGGDKRHPFQRIQRTWLESGLRIGGSGQGPAYPKGTQPHPTVRCATGGGKPRTLHDPLIALDDGQFARFVHENQDLFVLVRPDRYVWGAFHVGKEEAFVKALQRYLVLR